MYVDGITIRAPFCSLKRIEPKMIQDPTCQKVCNQVSWISFHTYWANYLEEWTEHQSVVEIIILAVVYTCTGIWIKDVSYELIPDYIIQCGLRVLAINITNYILRIAYYALEQEKVELVMHIKIVLSKSRLKHKCSNYVGNILILLISMCPLCTSLKIILSCYHNAWCIGRTAMNALLESFVVLPLVYLDGHCVGSGSLSTGY